MKRRQEIEVSNKLIKSLIERGFLVHKYYARTTKSVYLKFNLIKQYEGSKTVLDKGFIRLFYNYNNTEELITDIQNEKKIKINKYGLENYKKYMKLNSQDNLYKSFKKVA